MDQLLDQLICPILNVNGTYLDICSKEDSDPVSLGWDFLIVR